MEKTKETQESGGVAGEGKTPPPGAAAGGGGKRHWAVVVLRENLLVLLLVLALAVGIGLGLGLRSQWKPYEKEKIFYLTFPGHLLLGMLKMLILPLIVSSLITALASLDRNVRGKLGAAAVAYYMTTTLTAVILGIVLVLTIQPGYRSAVSDRSGSVRRAQWLPSLLDLIRNCFPDNLVEAAFLRQETELTATNFTWTENNVTEVVTRNVPALKDKGGMNVLGVLVFSVALGCVLNHLGEAGRPLQDFFQSLFAATMILVRLVIWYSPIGILFLIASKFVGMEQDPAVVFVQLGYYFLTVLAGLLVHGMVVLPLVFLAATRTNPYRFMLNMLKAICTAWGTASSSATLPVTLECLEFRNRVQPQVSRFVATVGATINMDGTALYEAVAAIFIAQVNQVSLSISQVIVISLTATAAAIGAAGVPQAGLVTMAIVLSAVGLPEEDISLILAVDWLLDRFRTAVNVLGDSMGAGILNHFFRNSILAAAPGGGGEGDENDLDVIVSETGSSSSPDSGESSPCRDTSQLENGGPEHSTKL